MMMTLVVLLYVVEEDEFSFRIDLSHTGCSLFRNSKRYRKEESVNGCSKLLLLRLLLDRIMGRINWQRSSEPKDTSESRLRA